MSILSIQARISQLMREHKNVEKRKECATLSYSCVNTTEALTFVVKFKVRDTGILSHVERSITFFAHSENEWVVGQLIDISKYLKGEITAHELFSKK